MGLRLRKKYFQHCKPAENTIFNSAISSVTFMIVAYLSICLIQKLCLMNDLRKLYGLSSSSSTPRFWLILLQLYFLYSLVFALDIFLYSCSKIPQLIFTSYYQFPKDYNIYSFHLFQFYDRSIISIIRLHKFLEEYKREYFMFFLKYNLRIEY